MPEDQKPDYLFQNYIEANAYIRNVFDNFFKLATISFSLNAILLTGLAILLGRTDPSNMHSIIDDLVVSLCWFGILFNSGAFFAYREQIKTWAGVHSAAAAIEFHMEIDKNFLLQNRYFESLRNPKTATSNKGMVFWLTNLFFLSLIVFWVGLGLRFVTDMQWNDWLHISY